MSVTKSEKWSLRLPLTSTFAQLAVKLFLCFEFCYSCTAKYVRNSPQSSMLSPDVYINATIKINLIILLYSTYIFSNWVVLLRRDDWTYVKISSMKAIDRVFRYALWKEIIRLCITLYIITKIIYIQKINMLNVKQSAMRCAITQSFILRCL